MIPESVLLARLSQLRRQWRKREFPSPFLDGVLLGLLMASQEVAVLWDETKAHFRRNPNYLAACLSNLAFAKRERHGK